MVYNNDIFIMYMYVLVEFNFFKDKIICLIVSFFFYILLEMS